MILKVTEAVIGGLKGHPALLGLIVLNCVFIAAALFFLNSLAESAARSRDQLMRDNAKQAESNDRQFELLLRLCAPRYGKWEP